MKEVDWSSDLLLSCCCLLLPVMSSNGIQLTTGEGKHGHGRGGVGCNGAVCACVYAWVDTGYWLPFVKMVCVCGVSLPEYTICAHISDLHSCWVWVRALPKSCRHDSLKCQHAVLRDVWRKAKGKEKKNTTRTRKKKVPQILKQKNNIQNSLKTNSKPLNVPFLTGTDHHWLAAGIKYDYIFPVFETSAYMLVIVFQHGKLLPQPFCSCEKNKQTTNTGRGP